MHVTDKSLKDIFEPSIGPLRVDQDSVFCDVVDGHVFQRRDVDFERIHDISTANQKQLGTEGLRLVLDGCISNGQLRLPFA